LVEQFNRKVHCLLGLPFDTIDTAEAARRIHEAASTSTRCFMSTPNLNFVIASMSDSAFRQSILDSDLVVADGMPLVWMARLLGIPIPERVAGSTVFQRLYPSAERPIAVYFFGGTEGVAEAACRRLNRVASGLICVGYEFPGFGSIETMSSNEIIDRINQSNTDFVVVALGAKKGQEWIQRNRARLSAPIISHLGAVVNFVAGTLTRAPVWMQSAGLEWFWRIKEEPALWRRYFTDGLVLLRLLITRVIPLACIRRFSSVDESEIVRAAYKAYDDGNKIVLELCGAWCENNLMPLRQAFSSVSLQGRNVCIDLTEVSHVDSAFLGLVMLLRATQAKGELGFSLLGLKASVARSFRYANAEYLLSEIPS
jgi:N-acetylglucosaminyldiphosphoundecaprenol N-acetyl-beta-D-mannosaminyltransferase